MVELGGHEPPNKIRTLSGYTVAEQRFAELARRQGQLGGPFLVFAAGLPLAATVLTLRGL